MHSGGQGIVSVDSDELPVSLALVDEAEGAEHLHLHYITHLVYRLADLDNVDGVLVSLQALKAREVVLRCLPSLRKGAVVPLQVAVLQNAEKCAHERGV